MPATILLWKAIDTQKTTWHCATQAGCRYLEACLQPHYVAQTEEVTQMLNSYMAYLQWETLLCESVWLTDEREREAESFEPCEGRWKWRGEGGEKIACCG